VEVVTSNGRTDFDLLGERVHGRRHNPDCHPLTLYVFDVLELEGLDLPDRPRSARRHILERQGASVADQRLFLRCEQCRGTARAVGFRLMAKDGKLEHLAKVQLFSTLNKRELAVVGKATDVVTMKAGKDIVREGSIGHELYLILGGIASVRRKGRKIATLTIGDYFGELALLDRDPRSATVTAETDLELAVITKRKFLSVLDQVPTVAHKLLVSMAGRLREADTKSFSH
jgi:CRP/FNR family transcriptional regulator, cyclic AMP receptor protein